MACPPTVGRRRGMQCSASQCWETQMPSRLIWRSSCSWFRERGRPDNQHRHCPGNLHPQRQDSQHPYRQGRQCPYRSRPLVAFRSSRSRPLAPSRSFRTMRVMARTATRTWTRCWTGWDGLRRLRPFRLLKLLLPVSHMECQPARKLPSRLECRQTAELRFRIGKTCPPCAPFLLGAGFKALCIIAHRLACTFRCKCLGARTLSGDWCISPRCLRGYL
mmetsp:Transcript_56691/g.184500  ORF Transcript_56691/g.184500 Transcript_56691/m.184500 type:complete len:218 (-) Transcript_56691:1097-1750(-)